MSGDFEPFISAIFSHDVTRDLGVEVGPGQAKPSGDRDDLRLGLGLRYFGENGISALVEWSVLTGCNDIDDKSLNLTLKAEF